jgi:hypothetical protein
MRVKHFVRIIQHYLLLFLLLVSVFFFGCNRSPSELPVLPPATHPLTREFIGFGVVIISFTHILSEPGSTGASQGYLRRGTVVRVIERRQINNLGRSELWVLVEGNYKTPGSVSCGWLDEATLVIYDRESRALTASGNMNQ